METIETVKHVKLMHTFDYIRELFIRNEDSLALQEFDHLLHEIEDAAREIPARFQETFQQLLIESLKCLETKDYVRLTDILIFEIKPLLNDLNGDD